MMNLVTGIDNTAIGTETMRDTSGNYNTAVGSQSLRNINGQYNTAIGYGSGKSNTTLSNTINIGPNARLDTSGTGILKFNTTENTTYPKK